MLPGTRLHAFTADPKAKTWVQSAATVTHHHGNGQSRGKAPSSRKFRWDEETDVEAVWWGAALSSCESLLRGKSQDGTGSPGVCPGLCLLGRILGSAIPRLQTPWGSLSTRKGHCCQLPPCHTALVPRKRPGRVRPEGDRQYPRAPKGDWAMQRCSGVPEAPVS